MKFFSSRHIHSSGRRSRVVDVQSRIRKPQWAREHPPMGCQQMQRQIYQMKSQRDMKQRHQWTTKTEITRLVKTPTRTLMQIRRRKYDRKSVRIGHDIGFHAASQLACQITDQVIHTFTLATFLYMFALLWLVMTKSYCKRSVSKHCS
jgi:hypothetical protein